MSALEEVDEEEGIGKCLGLEEKGVLLVGQTEFHDRILEIVGLATDRFLPCFGIVGFEAGKEIGQLGLPAGKERQNGFFRVLGLRGELGEKLVFPLADPIHLSKESNHAFSVFDGDGKGVDGNVFPVVVNLLEFGHRLVDFVEGRLNLLG